MWLSITKRLNYCWRLFATAWSFFIFGAAGIFCWGFVYPLLEPFLGKGNFKKRRSRYLMFRVFRVYMDMMRVMGILDYRVDGGERLAAAGRLVIANHPCLLDIVFLISQTPNATCIVKPGLVANPFMRIPIRAMGYIYADHPDSLLQRCAEELAAGSSLIVFPEGTRSTPGQPLSFLRGTAAIALHARCPIVPVVLDCQPTTLTKQLKWYQIPSRRFTLTMRVETEWPAHSDLDERPRSLAVRQVTRDWQAYYAQAMKNAPDGVAL